MINKIAFTGREDMLARRARSAAEVAVDKAHEYVSAGKIYSKAEIAKAKESALAAEAQLEKINKPIRTQYTSPFATTGAANNGDKLDINDYSYAVSHGAPSDRVAGMKLSLEA